MQLIIIDVMMPKLNGLSAVMKIREQKNIPIIILSAKSEDTDKVLGLSMGADDYVTKPYNAAELVARVKSHLRRYTRLGDIYTAASTDSIENGRLCYHKEEHLLYADGEPVKLTATETKIMELLKQEDGLPEHVKEYVSILDTKAQRLKTMVQDVFEVSRAASGELPVKMEKLDLSKLPQEPVIIRADGERLYRVFQNLIQNALKYSLSGSRIFIALQQDGKIAVTSVKNTSREELSPDIDYTERFTRGDNSRSDGGSGLGLSIARSFTEACSGSFQVETIADLFLITVAFSEVSKKTLTEENIQTPPFQ